MRDTIRFYLGSELIELDNADPTETVLDWLRLAAARTGTKEGCAEGDCGACTVVISRPNGAGGLKSRAVNACIQFLPTLDGAQVLTVEDLAQRGEPLHPVQQAMVDHHGSQCGFCTPGFVMSLFAVSKSAARSRDDLKQAFAGNLCRCTGYGPILTAGEAVLANPSEDRFDAGEAEMAARLMALGDGEMLALESGGRRYFAPATLAQFDQAISDYPDAQIIAGLTDVGLWVTKQGRRLDELIYIGNIAELQRMSEDDGVLEIAAGVTLADASDNLGDFSEDLGELMRRFASLQIRNSGTVCGNIANGSPIGDLPPALIALDAELILRKDGKLRTIKLEDFYIDYGSQDRGQGELVEAVRVPRPAGDVAFRCYKISKRFEQDISAVMAAFAVTCEAGKVVSARLAYGGMAGIPKRAAAAEAAMLGQPFTEDTIRGAMAAMTGDFTPLDDMRASAAYRLAAAQNLLLKFFYEVDTPDAATRVLEVAHG